MSPLTSRERREIDQANASGRTPVVFVHGLWLLANSWDDWRAFFEQAGYATLAPGWPHDPETVEEARRHPEALAGKGVKQITDHFADAIGQLTRKPAIIGHSFGGLIAQRLAGQGLSAATVAIDPAPSRGVLPLPFSSVKVASVALRDPANYRRSVMLTYEEFRYGFANAVDETEARRLYEAFSVPGPGRPLFQASVANFNPWSEASADAKNPSRGPMLVMSGELDHTVPPSVAHAAFARQQKNPNTTEFQKFKGRGHALIFDHGWRDVADAALAFLTRYVPIQRPPEETVPENITPLPRPPTQPEAWA